MREFCNKCNAYHEPDEHLPRYYVKTSYHVWSIIDRESQNPIQHFGARGRGDKAARYEARKYCNEMNERT